MKMKTEMKMKMNIQRKANHDCIADQIETKRKCFFFFFKLNQINQYNSKRFFIIIKTKIQKIFQK